MLTNSKVFREIKKLLQKEKVDYKFSGHEPVFTSQQAASERGELPCQGAKALVFIADKKPILIVIPGNRKVDTKKFKKTQQVKNLSLASKEVVEKTTGLEIGAIPPLGNLMGLPTYLDRKLTKEKKVHFNPGIHTGSITIRPADLIKLAKPIIGSFC